MFHRKQRRFRRRPNGRKHSLHNNGGHLRSNSFSNDQVRSNFRMGQSPEKLFEKYTSLAKEAISSGDKTLSENYLQHADHFMRIIEDRNKNKFRTNEKTTNVENNTSDKIDTNQSDKIDTNQKSDTKE